MNFTTPGKTGDARTLPTSVNASILAPLKVNNGPVPSSVTLLSPTAGTVLTGVVPVAFHTDLDSALGVAYVVLDGICLQCESGGNGFQFDSSQLADGPHSLTVYAGASDAEARGVYASSGAVAVSSANVAFGASFGGSNWLEATTSAALSPNQPMTFGCWVYLTSIATDQIIACKGNSGGTYEWILHFSTTLGFRCAIDVTGGGTESAWTGTTPSAGQWYHVAFTLAGSSLTVYQNAVPGGVNNSCSGTFTHANTYDLTFGRSLDGLEGLGGNLDEAGLWGASKTISNLYNGGAGKTFAELAAGDLTSLIGFWSFNEPTGAARADATANGHGAVDHGGVVRSFGHVI